MAKQIRDYQLKAKLAVESNLEKGVAKQLIVMPTGTGKTFNAIPKNTKDTKA